MYEPKMKENNASVIEFIEKIEQPRKREDAHRLLEIFEETTGYKAKMQKVPWVIRQQICQ